MTDSAEQSRTTTLVSSDEEPARRVGFGFIAVYAAAYCGLWIGLLTPVIVTLSLRVKALDPNNSTGSLSLVLGVGALLALVGNPFFGKLGDRTTSRFGRRRPWLVIGVLGGTLGLLVIALAPSISVVLVGWCLAQLMFNAALSASVAILPDQVPQDQRGLVSGFLGICIPVAGIVGTYIVSAVGSSTLLKFLVPALITIATTAVLVVVLKDKRARKDDLEPYSLGEFARSFWINPRTAPDFSWAWLGRFLLFMGLSFLLTYQAFYLTDHLHKTSGQIPGLIFKSTLTQSLVLIAVSLVVGPISDRLNRRKAFVYTSAVIYAAGLAVIAFAHSFDVFLIGMAVTGIGQGVYLAVDLALVADVLPSRETAARDLGVFNIASAMPQSLAPAIAPLFLAIDGPKNYVALFTVAAIFSAVGALAIVPIRKVR